MMGGEDTPYRRRSTGRPSPCVRSMRPCLAEGRDRLAGLRVQADQVAVAGADEDALVVPVGPVGNAAMHEAVVGRRSVLPRLRVVDPPGLACCSVDGSDLGHRGADIQHAVDHQRGGFPHPGFQIGIRFRDRFVGGAPCPRDLQAAEIVSRRSDRAANTSNWPCRRRSSAIPSPCLDLPRLSMRGMADKQPRVRSLQSCDQGRPGYQSFTPGPHSMDMIFIGSVTLIAHGSFLYN